MNEWGSVAEGLAASVCVSEWEPAKNEAGNQPCAIPVKSSEGSSNVGVCVCVCEGERERETVG